MEYSPKRINDKLLENNFNFKKKFGQNFITDENIINKIVSLSLVDKETMVIEIGPGSGSLTYKLAEKAKNVLCYEIDTTLENILKENLKEYSNVDIIFNDFLKSNIIKDLKQYTYQKLYIVANLPYYITTPIITKIIEDQIPVDKLVVMVQKEVGDRFKATPGSKDYNSLSIYLNHYFSIKKIMDVSKNIFIPKPNVDSIILEFIPKENQVYIKNKDFFFKLVKDSFKQKRKTLKNNLKDYDLDQIEKILNQYNYDLSVRAEELSEEMFAKIANGIGDRNESNR